MNRIKRRQTRQVEVQSAGVHPGEGRGEGRDSTMK